VCVCVCLKKKIKNKVKIRTLYSRKKYEQNSNKKNPQTKPKKLLNYKDRKEYKQNIMILMKHQTKLKKTCTKHFLEMKNNSKRNQWKA
jgi:hypothetical protein